MTVAEAAGHNWASFAAGADAGAAGHIACSSSAEAAELAWVQGAGAGDAFPALVASEQPLQPQELVQMAEAIAAASELVEEPLPAAEAEVWPAAAACQQPWQPQRPSAPAGPAPSQRGSSVASHSRPDEG